METYRSVVSFEGIKVNIMGINELIKSKKRIKRKIDVFDVEKLRYILRKKLTRRRR